MDGKRIIYCGKCKAPLVAFIEGEIEYQGRRTPIVRGKRLQVTCKSKVSGRECGHISYLETKDDD